MKKKKSKKLQWRLISVAGVLFFLFAGYEYLKINRFDALERDGQLRIYPEMTVDDVLRNISEECGIVHPFALKRIFLAERVEQRLKPGSYLLKKEYSARYIARMISRGWQEPVDLVISGRIRTKEDLSRIISSQMLASQQDILRVLNDSMFLASIGTTPSRVFEMIIPDTYEIYWNTPAIRIIERLKAERDKFWNEDRMALCSKVGLTPEQVSVLASIVSEESSRPDEYPKIASVYLTRLKKGMKLQACPTVCFLLDYKVKRVLNRHLKIDSPYNTYMYGGLPPGPIALADKKHIEAVLHPDKNNFLYFCADSSFNGRNVFSSTLSEHNRHRNEYVKAVDSRKKKTE